MSSLLMMGAGDPDFDVPAAEADRPARQLGDLTQVITIDGAGHYRQIEQPDQTAKAIMLFSSNCEANCH